MRALLLIFIFLSTRLRAQEPSYYFEKRTVQHGLSHNKVNCILQDQRGFMWIGTDDGLNRYDGNQFVHFRHRPGDSTSISGNIITDLLEDKAGLLWIATADGGLSRYDFRAAPNLQFRQYKHIPGNPASIPINSINSILEDRFGNLWLATSGMQVLHFNKKIERFFDVAKSGKTALDLCLDKNGMIWVGRQGGGILKINPATLATTEDPRYSDLYANLPHATVTALYRDAAHNIWYGSWDKVLYRYNASKNVEESFLNNGPFSFQNDEINCFTEDKWGRLWMGGKERGLQVYDRSRHRFYNFRYDPSREGTIADNRINCVYRDRNGRIWLGTSRGLCIHQPDRQQFTQQFLQPQANTNLILYDFFEDENNDIWIGTSQGIFVRKKEGRLQHRPLSFKGVPLQVTSFYKDNKGTIYLGTDYSVFRYNPITGQVALLPNTEKDGVMNRIITSRVVCMANDTINGHPVLLTLPYGHYLTYYDFVDRRWVSRLDRLNIIERFNLKDNLIRNFYRTKKGDAWMATAKEGLALWTKQSLPRASYFKHDPRNPASIANNNVFDMAEDEKGNLWITTNGGGLHYFDTRTKTFIQIPASNNLAEGVQLDHRGHVWMISNGNLHRYDPVRKTYTSFQLPDMEKSGGVKGTIFKDSMGNLYVAGSNYYIVFHPDSILDVRSEPRVHLTDFQIFNQSYSHYLQQEKITLHHNDNHFGFEFSAPDFTPGCTVRYSYKLDGFDRDWVDAGDRNYVSYSNLEGGEYTFRVRVTTTPGSWGEQMATVKLNIIPPYWKQAWFFLGSAILIAVIVLSIYRYRINELLKRQAIRNKIAQDLHDNVGSTLSSISVYTQVARIYQQQSRQGELHNTLEKISTTSSEMISELNDTVWAINPRNDNMEIILQRMESFAKPLLNAQGIQFNIQYEPQVAALSLEMEKRKSFYSIFKEAVNNVIKYSEAKRMEVIIRQKGHHLLLHIRDDGKGFDLSETSKGYTSSDVQGGGNGLKNMQQRAGDMNGTLHIKSEPGKGTQIELDFPIP